MINPNSSSIQATSLGISRSSGAISSVRSTFQEILGQLANQPLKPLGIQQFAGSGTRSLAHQIHSDTALIR
jgi:hypothetical protein